jgi:hypothetical protein
MNSMEEILQPTHQPTHLSRRQFRMILLAGVLLLGLIGVAMAWYIKDLRSASMAEEHDLQVGQLANRFGIEVTLIGINEASGLIQFGYRVIDANKALDVANIVANFPKLIAEKNGKVLSAPQVIHHTHNLEAGRSYFFFIGNQHGALSPGDLVTVVIGDVQVKHFVAQ